MKQFVCYNMLGDKTFKQRSETHLFWQYNAENNSIAGISGISNHLFVSQYQLYLPDKETLSAELEKLLGAAPNGDVE